MQQSLLNDYDVLLSGYIPSAEAVEAVGKIGRDLKFSAGMKAGSFFWGMIMAFVINVPELAANERT